jgi:hypothetical protein
MTATTVKTRYAKPLPKDRYVTFKLPADWHAALAAAAAHDLSTMGALARSAVLARLREEGRAPECR